VARSSIAHIGPDGHGNRASVGADAYYADMDGIWTDTGSNVTSYAGGISAAVKEGKINVAGDGKFDPGYMSLLGSGSANYKLELGFGRIDFSNQIAAEYESTRNYFNKLHRYKTAAPDFQPGRKAMHRTLFGMVSHAYLASMPGVVGMTNAHFLTKADLPSDPPAGSIDGDADAAYTRDVAPYLFYFKGDGSPGASHDSRAVFWTGLQSHWGYWFETGVSSGQNKMQRRLAEDNYSLSYTWYISINSYPAVNYLYHRFGMGGDAGDMMQTSMSGRMHLDSPYMYAQDPVLMAHMGDPALRIYMFAPPTDLQVLPNGGSPSLSWTASVAPAGEPQVLGYHIYRSANSAGPFTRLTAAIVAGTTYTDTTASSGEWFYQVKAVRLETCGGGTYYNSSLAVQQSVDLAGDPATLTIDPAELPDANWDTDYEAQLTATGGPDGLTLAADGTLSGKSTTNGLFFFTASVTDALGQTTQLQKTLTVSALDIQAVMPEASGYVAKSVPTYTSRHYEPAMQISGGPTYVDSGYVRFDLSNIHTNDSFVQAQLVLMVDGLTPSNSPIVVKAVLSADAGDSWTETTLTYNNRPADSATVPAITATNLAVQHEQMVLDISDLVLDTLQNDPSQKLTVRLYSDTSANWGQSVRIANRYATSLARPTLIVQTTGSGTYEPPVTAAFSANPVSGNTPLAVTFTDTSSGPITNRLWNFGDGTTTNTTQTSIAHTYVTEGSFTVSLTVSSATSSDISTQPNLITVSLPAPPVASFSATPTSGNFPLAVAFSDTSTGTVANRFWDFGDGATSNTAATTVSHTYTAEGIHTVQLIVSGGEGASTNTQVNLIDVATPPPADDITISSDAADTFIGLNSGGTPVPYYAGQDTLNMGDDNFGSSQGDNCAVVVFELPDLEGKTIAIANLTVEIKVGWPGAASYPLGVDLYGIRYADSPTVLASDYGFNGSGPGSLIQDNVWEISSNINVPYAPFETDGAGDAVLAGWVSDQYTAGAQPGDYVFLRYELDTSTANQVQIASADNTEAGVGKPTLTLGFGVAGSTITDWRMAYYGTTNNTGNAADDADPMGDGYPNLLKYVLGMIPTNNYDGSPYAPYAQMQDPHGVTYTFTHDTGVSDATLMVEGTFSLTTNNWIDIDPLDPINQVSVEADTPEAGIETITIKDTQPNATNRFLRLKATRP